MDNIFSMKMRYFRKIVSFVIVYTLLSTMSPSIAKADESTGVFTIVDGVLTKYNGTASEVTVPDGVTGIGGEAFANNLSIQKVILPNSVTSIGIFAFSGCSNLENVVLPSALTSIDNYAFELCHKLSGVTIPAGVVKLNVGVFRDCKSIKSITIPDTIEDIEANAFVGCSSLTSINLPSGLARIAMGTFQHCESLESIIIPDTVTTIEENAFAACYKLRNVIVPKSVLHIGSDAFYRCSNLILTCYEKSEMEKYAIEFGIPYFLADRCTIISETQGSGSITPNGKVQAVTGSSITFNITANFGYTLGDVLVDNVSQGKINTYTFNNILTDHIIKAVFIASVTPSPTTSPSGGGNNSGGGYPSGGGGFSGGPTGGGNNQPTVTPPLTPTITPTITPTPSIAPIQESTTSAPSIGKIITDKKSKISYIVTVSTDNKKEVAFVGTNEAKSNLDIPSEIKINEEEYQVTTIKRKALYNNKNLTSVTIGKNITEIGTSAFASCDSLSSITLGSNVEILGKNIFSDDQNLKKIIIKSKKLKKVDERAFSNMSGDVTIYVPVSKYDEYKELLKNKGLKKTVKIRRLKE